MNKEEFIHHHWNYYMMLERKTIYLEEYVSFDDKNKKCFSKAFMNLIISICCEFEIICKMIINMNGNDKGDIKIYREKILEKESYKDICIENLKILDLGNIELTPLKDFDLKTPEWWQAYNSLKHNRINGFKKANLINLLNSLGALYILEVYYFKERYQVKETDLNTPTKLSKLFLSEIYKPNYNDKLGFRLLRVIDDNEIE